MTIATTKLNIRPSNMLVVLILLIIKIYTQSTPHAYNLSATIMPSFSSKSLTTLIFSGSFHYSCKSLAVQEVLNIAALIGVHHYDIGYISFRSYNLDLLRYAAEYRLQVKAL